MLTITKKLDMSPHGVPQVIRVSQYDSDFTLEFKLFASGGNFEISTGTTAEIRGTKQSGTGYSASATLNTSTKIVTVAGAAQMTAIAGMNIFEIVLKKNNKEISSANFCLLVERAALDADTITDESVLQELNAIIEGAETATQAAEEAEDAADRAEAAAIEAELAAAQAVLSDETKQALLACFEHLVWANADGRDYYNALEEALYPPVSLVEITAVFNQGQQAFYTNDSLNSLKQCLTVTAHYSDLTTETVDDYTLSGTLSVGTSTITVTYEEKTTTFGVTVSSRRRAELPDTYEQVEYIKPNGTKYIDPGILSQVPFEANITAKFTPQDGAFVMGGQSGGTDRFYVCARIYTSAMVIANRFGDTQWFGNVDHPSSANVKYDIVSGITNSGNKAKSYIGYDGDYIEQEIAIPTTGKAINIFRNPIDSSISNANSSLLYSIKFYAGNTLLFDGIPCYRKSDDVSGLYDAVSDTFLSGTGTGNFGIGEIVE